MLADSTWLQDAAPILLAVIGTGGIGGAIIALVKLRPEAGQITVVAAQGALVVQSGVIETLNGEVKRLAERLEAAEAELVRMQRLEDENYKLRTKITDQDIKIKKLETRVKELENGNGHKDRG